MINTLHNKHNSGPKVEPWGMLKKRTSIINRNRLFSLR